MELFFFVYGGRLGKVTGAKMEVVVVEMVGVGECGGSGGVVRVVWANLEVLLEVFVLV